MPRFNGGGGGGGSPAQIPASVSYASKLASAVLDCDLSSGAKNGGGTATDDTTPINNFLANGTHNNQVNLKLDGGALMAGVVIPTAAHVTIEGQGWDTGFFTKPNCNTFGIANSTYGTGLWGGAGGWDPGSASVPAIVDNTSIRLANFKLNANRGGSGSVNSGNVTGASSGTDPHGTLGNQWLSGIDLNSVANIHLENLWIYDPPAYHVRILNTKHVFIDKCRFQTNGPLAAGSNTDGVHISGGAEDVHITNSYFKTGDDAIAINADEGFSQPIKQVYVDNIELDGCLSGFRLYGGAINVDNCSISNMRGSVIHQFCLFGIEGGSALTEALGNSVFDNIDIDTGYGTMYSLFSGCAQLMVRNNILRGAVSGGFFFDGGGGTNNHSEIVIENSSIQMTAAKHAADQGLLRVGGATNIGRFVVNGFKASQPTNAGYVLNYLIDMNGGTIGELVIDALDSSNINALVNTARAGNGWGGVTKVSGAGVLASGFKIPDGLMMNGVPYISNTSGLPSIKTGGTVNGTDGTVTTITTTSPTFHSHYAMHSSRFENGNKASGLTHADTDLLRAGTGSMSLFAFVKADAEGNFVANMVSKATLGGGFDTNWEWFWGINNSQQLFFLSDTVPTGYSVTGSTNMVANQWYSLGAVFDFSAATAKLRVFLNGVQDGSDATASTHNILQSTNALTIGTSSVYNTWGLGGSLAMVGRITGASGGSTGVLTAADYLWLTNLVGGIPQGRSLSEITGHTFANGKVGTATDFLFSDAIAAGTDSGANAFTMTVSGAPTKVAGPDQA